MAGPKKRYANSNKFLKDVDDDGSVTLTRKGGKYDEGRNKKYDPELNDSYRALAGAAKAKTIKKFGAKEANDTARVMRETTAKRKAKNDASFFKHNIKDN